MESLGNLKLIFNYDTSRLKDKRWQMYVNKLYMAIDSSNASNKQKRRIFRWVNTLVTQELARQRDEGGLLMARNEELARENGF